MPKNLPHAKLITITITLDFSRYYYNKKKHTIARENAKFSDPQYPHHTLTKNFLMTHFLQKNIRNLRTGGRPHPPPHRGDRTDGYIYAIFDQYLKINPASGSF